MFHSLYGSATTINSSKNIINYTCFPEGSVICNCCLLTELPKTTLRSLSIGGCKEKYPLRKKSILQIIDCKSQKRLLSMFTALRFWPFDLFLSIVGPICQIRIFQKQLWAQFLSFVKDSIIVCEKINCAALIQILPFYKQNPQNSCRTPAKGPT